MKLESPIDVLDCFVFESWQTAVKSHGKTITSLGVALGVPANNCNTRIRKHKEIRHISEMLSIVFEHAMMQIKTFIVFKCWF
jgi:hypothetical protein